MNELYGYTQDVHDDVMKLLNDDRPTQVQSKGQFKLQCYNPDGSLAWEEEFPNGATTSGLNDMLAVAFTSGTQKTTWYAGLIDNAGFVALNPGDTMSSHAGWVENVSYSEGSRPAWSGATPSGGAITTTGTMNFTATGTPAIVGAFIVSNNTKGGASGQLWATGLLSGVQTLSNGQVLKLTYSHTFTPTN